MKNYILFLVIILFFSCEEKKIEFVQSKVTKSLFLIKNPPKNDSLLKKEIEFFLMKNPSIYKDKRDQHLSFFEYNWDTSYFLDNKGYGGVGTNTLDMYQKYGIAEFQVSKCKNDTTKLVGELRFYNSTRYDFYKPDTIIYTCK